MFSLCVVNDRGHFSPSIREMSCGMGILTTPITDDLSLVDPTRGCRSTDEVLVVPEQFTRLAEASSLDERPLQRPERSCTVNKQILFQKL